jgi:hypothetical protein
LKINVRPKMMKREIRNFWQQTYYFTAVYLSVTKSHPKSKAKAKPTEINSDQYCLIFDAFLILRWRDKIAIFCQRRKTFFLSCVVLHCKRVFSQAKQIFFTFLQNKATRYHYIKWSDNLNRKLKKMSITFLTKGKMT